MAARPRTDRISTSARSAGSRPRSTIRSARRARTSTRSPPHPADRAPVKYILTHLHQATGALAMVGLGAATRFNEELERLVVLGGDVRRGRRSPRACRSPSAAISALSGYLDALIAGEARPPDVAASRLPRAQPRARGIATRPKGDLFHPDLGAALPPPAEPAAAMDDAVLAKALAHQRVASTSRACCEMLRGGDSARGVSRSCRARSPRSSRSQAATPNRAVLDGGGRFLRRARVRRPRARRRGRSRCSPRSTSR